MKILRFLFWLVLTLVGIFVIFLVYSTLDNYNPSPTEEIFKADNPPVINDSTFSIVIWNLGYAGLDSTMDFFYDGGENVRPEKEAVNLNIQKILDQLKQFGEKDFVLLQEVDKKSKRSYRNNIYEMIAQSFHGYYPAFGKNYDVAFVPLPVSKPMGSVISGLQTLSSYLPEQVTRHSFPGNYAWPMSIFMLDRCFLVNRYPLPDGSELLIINTHNSAYDDGSLRKQQMDFLRDFLLSEYNAGNHIVVGGDWNQCPPKFEPQFSDDIFDTDDLTYIEEGYPAEGWSWAYDASTPTNRRVLKPYHKGSSPTTVIDFFLLSPDIEIESVQGVDMEFAWSDHQPVVLEFKIN